MTDFYADYISKTTFDPKTNSVRSKLEEAATDTKKKPASKTPKLEVEPTEIPEKKELEKEELHGDQHKLDHNKDMKITTSDMKKVREKGAVKDHPAKDTTDEAMIIRSKKSSAKLRRDAESRPMGVREDDEELEEATFRVSVSGLPTMHISGSSAGEIKTSLRKMLKDPKALGNIEKITPSEKKSDLRAKMSEAKRVVHSDRPDSLASVKVIKPMSKPAGKDKNYPPHLQGDSIGKAKAAFRKTKMSEDQTVADYLKKGGKITKVPAGKAQGAHGDSRMASGIAGQLSTADTSRFKTKKKVKSMEDVEQVDEISRNMKMRYTRSAARDVSTQASKGLNDKQAVRKSLKRLRGIDMATKRPFYDKGVKEEDNLNELDKKTMGSYIKKATHDVDNRSFAQGMRSNNKDYTSADASNNRNIRNRRAGIARAANKMSEGAMKRMATQEAEKERLGPKVKGSGLDTFKKKPKEESVKVEEKDTHVTKDGRTVKKGLWYYMNKRKKAGTSRPASAGTVSPEAMRKSQS